MSLSPNGQEFWYTGEYIGYASSRKTRIFSFNLQSQLDIDAEDKTKAPTLTLMQDDESIIVNGLHLPSSKEFYVDLFDINGKQISAHKKAVVKDRKSTRLNSSHV